MKFNIYNYYNEPTEVDTGDKEIRCIMIEIITGDEFIHMLYEDGTIEHYRSDVLLFSFCHYRYTVPKERVQEWIDLEKTAQGAISYYRLEKFYKEIKDNTKTKKK